MKLSNQYRIARLTKLVLSPEYSWVRSNRRIAINRAIFNQAMGRFNRGGLPFEDLFEKNATRLVIPYANVKKGELEFELKKIGYSKINWETGEAIKITQPGPGAPAGAKPKENSVKIGKAIGRLPNAQEWVKWWSDNQEVINLNDDDYSIIISRHPVDVIRMSDHQDIESCHSPGEGEWKSCVLEMQHGGMVAYMVKNEDLETVPWKQVTGEDEVFLDHDRNVDGIEPISRIRIRRFTHIKDGFDLAIPEMGVYGQYEYDSTFQGRVEDWARDSQADLMLQKRWRAKDFARRGGRYYDTLDSTLFNNFYRDNVDPPEESQHGIPGVEDEEDQDAINVRHLREMQEIQNEWDRRFNHSETTWDEFEENTYDYGADEEENQTISFTWNGKIRVDIPKRMFTDPDALGDVDALLNRKARSLNKYLSIHGFESGNRDAIELDDFNTATATFIIKVGGFDEDEGHGGAPTWYNDYCLDLYTYWDSKYEKLQKTIIQWLMEEGFAHPTPVRQFEGSNIQFENFRVTINKGDMEAVAQAFVGAYELDYWNEHTFNQTVNAGIRARVSSELEKIIRTRKNPHPHLPGIEPEHQEPIKEDYNLNNFSAYMNVVKENEDEPKRILLKITFKAGDLTSREDMQEVLELMKVVDRMFPAIVESCREFIKLSYQMQMDFNRSLSRSLFNKT